MLKTIRTDSLTNKVQLTMVIKLLFILLEISLNSRDFLAISILQ